MGQSRSWQGSQGYLHLKGEFPKYLVFDMRSQGVRVELKSMSFFEIQKFLSKSPLEI